MSEKEPELTPEEIQKRLEESKKQFSSLMDAMNPLGNPNHSKDAEQEAEAIQAQANQQSSGGPVSDTPVVEMGQAVLGQGVLGRNILNYHGANKSYIDAIHTAKTLGILDEVRDGIAPFPQTTKVIQVQQQPEQQPQETEDQIRARVQEEERRIREAADHAREIAEQAVEAAKQAAEAAQREAEAEKERAQDKVEEERQKQQSKMTNLRRALLGTTAALALGGGTGLGFWLNSDGEPKQPTEEVSTVNPEPETRPDASLDVEIK